MQTGRAWSAGCTAPSGTPPSGTVIAQVGSSPEPLADPSSQTRDRRSGSDSHGEEEGGGEPGRSRSMGLANCTFYSLDAWRQVDVNFAHIGNNIGMGCVCVFTRNSLSVRCRGVVKLQSS